jgi:hypothetical protein
MMPPIPVFPVYLVSLIVIARRSAAPCKTVMWMLITLVITVAAFVGLAGLVSSPEVAYALGGLGSLTGMIASIAVGIIHMRWNKRPAL